MKLNNILFTLAAFAGVATAQAVPELQITINSTQGDYTLPLQTGTQTGNNGFVSYSGSIGGVNLDLSFSESGNVNGTATYPSMDIDSFEASFATGVTGTITVALSDNNFGPTDAGVLAGFGGFVSPSVSASVALATYYSNSNALFAETNLITNYPLTAYTGAGANQNGGINSGASQYSLTEVLTVSGSGAGSVSVDAGLTTVPDGATTALLVGAGLLGLGVVASRRKLTVA